MSTPNKLREEWFNNPKKLYQPNKQLMIEIADWWLKRRTEELTMLEEKIQTMGREHTVHSEPICHECVKEYGYDQAVLDFYELLKELQQ